MISSFPALRTQVDRSTSASWMCEVVQRLTPEEQESPEKYDLLHDALVALSESPRMGMIRLAFAVRFLAMCRKDKVPLNFFSWHCYTADPTELGTRSRAIRQLLDSHGFTETESHLNEWNHLPGNDWAGMLSTDAEARHLATSQQMSFADFVRGRSRAVTRICRRIGWPVVTKAQASALPATPVKGWRRLWHATSKTHSAWVTLLARIFIVLMMLSAALLLLAFFGLVTGWMPVQMGDLQLDGVEGLALGSIGLLIGFGAVALGLAIVVAVIYGLGFLFAGLLVFIPAVILIFLFPVLSPFILIGLGLWWLVKRRRA